MPKDHSDPVADLRSNTSVPFEQARAMPTSVYTDVGIARACSKGTDVLLRKSATGSL